MVFFKTYTRESQLHLYHTVYSLVFRNLTILMSNDPSIDHFCSISLLSGDDCSYHGLIIK